MNWSLHSHAENVHSRKFAEHDYRKGGRVSSEYASIKVALKIVHELYGRMIANEFGPLALKAIQQRMIDKGWSRGYINKSIGRIRRCFKWAVENELVRPNMYHGPIAVSGLRKGRSEAHEADPVQPVDDATVQATLPHLTSTVADMVRLQRITRCRPQDVCNLRPCDIDMSADVWLYRFYALYDKVYREDVLWVAYRRCLTNGGAAGVDGQTFEDIEQYGMKKWLGELVEGSGGASTSFDIQPCGRR